MKAKNIIWGLLLVFLGTLFILKNFDVIYFNWHSVFRLWPFIFVFIGISILPVKNTIKIALAVIALAIAALILALYPSSYIEWGPRWWFRSDRDRIERWKDDFREVDQSIIEPFDSAINEANLVFDAAAGTFNIYTSTDELFEFNRRGGFGKYHYSIKESGNSRLIKIDFDGGSIRRVKVTNDVEIKLNPNPAWDLNIDVGAASMDLDLTDFIIRKVNIDGGASSIDLRLGDRSDNMEVDIESGASSITIKIPEEFACEVRTSTVLSSKSLNGFNKVSDGTYITENFSSEDRNILINIDAAISSLTIQRYR
jgi:hypothetical protein